MIPTESGNRFSWPVPADAAEAMVNQSLNACVDQMHAASLDASVEQLRRGDPAAWSYCQRALAQRVGEYLQACDGDVKAVYLYDVDWTPDDANWTETGEPPLIHLIVWAQPKTAALRALIAVLNRALAHRFGRVIAGHTLTQLLDVQVIDDQDVAQRAGYASLLSSSRHRPVRVWGALAETV